MIDLNKNEILILQYLSDGLFHDMAPKGITQAQYIVSLRKLESLNLIKVAWNDGDKFESIKLLTWGKAKLDDIAQENDQKILPRLISFDLTIDDYHVLLRWEGNNYYKSVVKDIDDDVADSLEYEGYLIPGETKDDPEYRLSRKAKLILNKIEHAIDETTQVQHKERRKRTFRDLVQGVDKDKILRRLHARIDGRGGKEVAAVLLKAKDDGLIWKLPSENELNSEFKATTVWRSISKYLGPNPPSPVDFSSIVL